MKVKLKDNSIREFPQGTKLFHIAKAISRNFAKRVITAEVDGKKRDLSYQVCENCSVEFFTFDSAQGKDVFWHSSAHLMAQAVKELFPEVKVAIGPSIEYGFYYDFEKETAFDEKDLKKIEKKMRFLAKQGLKYTRQELSSDDALEHFSNVKESYKVEIVKELQKGEVISTYSQGSFTDLCRGPHLASTSAIGAIKLTKTSGAYWRGDEKNTMLKRIYGITFPTSAQMDDYLLMLAEAKKRDHRELGKTHGLFSVSDEIGAGLILWHPKGATIRNIIETFWKKEHIAAGYNLINTPHVGKASLWQTSGHLGFFNESMYSPIDIEGNNYYIKPMNCPFHIEIYNTTKKSYRELPIRYAELGTVYRYERSGTLHGLLRVRGFTQDDAHIICTQEQVDEEIDKVLGFSIQMLNAFGFKDLELFVSTMPPKFVGRQKDWQKAEGSLRSALKNRGIAYQVEEGGGAFYGPKIDIKIKDAIGRSWQCSTIQFDFNLPERFGMEFVAADNKTHRPFMIHRALLGSLERFFGILIEHFAADFPLWLSPIQMVVIPVSQNTTSHAQKLLKQLKDFGFRVDLDERDEKVSYKIRDAELNKYPYMIVIGQKEVESGRIAVRRRKEGDLGQMSLEAFVAGAKDEIRHKR